MFWGLPTPLRKGISFHYMLKPRENYHFENFQTFFLASLPGGTRITVEFVDQLLEHYREQKLLHRRYAFQILLDARNYFMSQPSLVNITVILNLDIVVESQLLI